MILSQVQENVNLIQELVKVSHKLFQASCVNSL